MKNNLFHISFFSGISIQHIFTNLCKNYMVKLIKTIGIIII